MAIRILVAPDPHPFVRFAVSPLMEAALSLNAYLFPRERPLQHPWLRAMRGLSPALRREIRAFGWLLDWALPDCLLPDDADATDWESELGRVAALEPVAAAYALARPAFFYVADEPAGLDSLADASVQEQIAVRARRHGTAALRCAALAHEDPPALLGRFVEMLAAYWDRAFAAEWGRIGPSLAEAAAVDAARADHDGLYSVIDGPFTDTVVDRVRGAIVRKSPHEHTVAATNDRPLLLLPSLYVWPHTRANCDEPWPLALIYPPAAVRSAARPEPVPGDLVAGLRALADPARLQALQLMSERPRTTEELAPLLGLSPAGASKHLKVLADAGLVKRRRDGWYVLYSVQRRRLDELAAQVSRLSRRRPRTG